MKKLFALATTFLLVSLCVTPSQISASEVLAISMTYTTPDGDTHLTHKLTDQPNAESARASLLAKISGQQGTVIHTTETLSPLPIETDSTEDSINLRRWAPLNSVSNLGDANRAATGKGVVIAVVDSGVNGTHPDITNNLYYKGYSSFHDDALEDSSGHGTGVAQVAAGVRNSIGIQGIAYNAKIMSVKVDRHDGKMYQDGIAEGVYWAANNGADIINISNSQNYDNENMRAAVGYADSRGVIVVVSAGNDGQDKVPNAIRYPASYPNVITVGNWNAYLDELHPSSNTRGSDFINPGVVYISDPSRPGLSKRVVGTSYAAPYTAGTIALLLEQRPNLTRTEVYKILKKSSRQKPSIEGGPAISGTYNFATGWGMPDIEASVSQFLKSQVAQKTLKTSSINIGKSVTHTVKAASETILRLQVWNTSSKAWDTVSSTKTKNKKATFKFTPKGSSVYGKYRVVAALNKTHRGGVILSVNYLVKKPVAYTTKIKSKKVERNDSLKVTVKTRTKTTVQLQVKSGKKWKNVGKRVTTKSNKAKLKVPTNKTGTKNYRIVAKGTSKSHSVTTNSFKVTVKKPKTKEK